jgi:hypothetical protein
VEFVSEFAASLTSLGIEYRNTYTNVKLSMLFLLPFFTPRVLIFWRISNFQSYAETIEALTYMDLRFETSSLCNHAIS